MQVVLADLSYHITVSQPWILQLKVLEPIEAEIGPASRSGNIEPC